MADFHFGLGDEGLFALCVGPAHSIRPCHDSFGCFSFLRMLFLPSEKRERDRARGNCFFVSLARVPVLPDITDAGKNGIFCTTFTFICMCVFVSVSNVCRIVCLDFSMHFSVQGLTTYLSIPTFERIRHKANSNGFYTPLWWILYACIKLGWKY